MFINKTKLLENFINIDNFSNLKLLVCYRNLFSKDGILNNIGNFILIFCIIFHLISIFIFYISYINKVKKIIKDIEFALRNINLIKNDKIINTKSKIEQKNKNF
jgi:hypothetical protein